MWLSDCEEDGDEEEDLLSEDMDANDDDTYGPVLQVCVDTQLCVLLLKCFVKCKILLNCRFSIETSISVALASHTRETHV